jgi:hypothetical protein
MGNESEQQCTLLDIARGADDAHRQGAEPVQSSRKWMVSTDGNEHRVC